MTHAQDILDKLPDTGSEEHDIFFTMEDNANTCIEWIKDCVTRQYMRDNGKRIDARTRHLIQYKSYEIYLKMGKRLHNKIKRNGSKILNDIEK